jgi:hypothetical protein
MVDEKPVHWIGDCGNADAWEQACHNASPLRRLLILNSRTLEGLTADEIVEADWYILGMPKVTTFCIKCLSKLAVGDTGLCREHNMEALRTKSAPPQN